MKPWFELRLHNSQNKPCSTSQPGYFVFYLELLLRTPAPHVANYHLFLGPSSEWSLLESLPWHHSSTPGSHCWAGCPSSLLPCTRAHYSNITYNSQCEPAFHRVHGAQENRLVGWLVAWLIGWLVGTINESAEGKTFERREIIVRANRY